MFHLRIIPDVSFEFWRDIPGYEGLYQASTYGRVKSLERYYKTGRGGMQLLPERILKTRYRGEYLAVHLCKDGTVKTYNVHRLVALTFPEICGKQFDGATVDHKNGIKNDNRAENLRVCTLKENLENPITKPKRVAALIRTLNKINSAHFSFRR